MKNELVLRVVARFLIPFILLLALYVQLHGEYSPGGGFQAGTIAAAACILYALVFSVKEARKAIPDTALRLLAVLGVLLYAGTGVVTLLLGGNYLEYGVLAPGNMPLGQKIGIMAVELGVGLTVFAVMLILYFAFAGRSLSSSRVTQVSGNHRGAPKEDTAQRKK